MALEDAKQQIGYNLVFGGYTEEENSTPKGTVLRQFPEAGTEVDSGTVVAVVISAGKRPVDSSTAQNGTGSTADYDYSFEGNKITITKYKGSGGNVVIPATIDGKNVTSIGKEAFWQCTSLTTITIPNSVTSIGEEAFMNCSELTSVTVQNGVDSIESGAFRGCSSLNSITIPISVSCIETYAFYDSGLCSIYFMGDAPTLGSGEVYRGQTFPNSIAIYYKLGTTGWDNQHWSDIPK